MHRIGRKDDPTTEKPLARILAHPSLKKLSARHKGDEQAASELVIGHRPSGDQWLVNGEELFNGCILEMRLSAPAVWLQVRIEGLPEHPSACFHLLDDAPICVPLPAGALLRWPRSGIDRSLVTRVVGTPVVDAGST